MKAAVVVAVLGSLAPVALHAQPLSAPLTVTVDQRARLPRAVPATVPLGPSGLVQILTPFAVVDAPGGPALVHIPHYQGPDGSYDNLGDLSNAINGVPCGLECREQALQRWGYRP